MERMDRIFSQLEEFIAKSSNNICTDEGKKQLTEKVKETKERLGTPLETDKWIYRIVVALLGLAILASLFFTFFLAVQSPSPNDLKIPEIFLAIGSAAVGALAGLLAPSPSRENA